MNRVTVLLTLIVVVSNAMEPAGYYWGMATRQGVRRTQEDTHFACVRTTNGVKEGIFAVFDGHGGDQASLLARDNLIAIFDAHADYAPGDRIHTTFKELDQLICQATESGTTAVVAHVLRDKVTIGWVGDSRALHIRNNQVIAATQDHKPNVPGERKRIEDEGGRVIKYGAWRIDGLAVSRALGDAIIKSYTRGAIIAEPDIDEWLLEPGDQIVLCCDGVFDVLTNDEVAQLLTHDRSLYDGSTRELHTDDCYKIGFPSECLSASYVRDCAYQRMSGDNITVLLMTYLPNGHSNTDC